MTITKEQLSKLPDELVLKAVNACMEYAYVSECCEASVERLIEDLGVEIKEKLNAKKKVDYSVLVKHGIDVTDNDGKEFFLANCHDTSFLPRLNHWFSALNFDDVEQVVEDLLAAGFDVETCESCGDVEAFKINGAAEGCEW